MRFPRTHSAKSLVMVPRSQDVVIREMDDERDDVGVGRRSRRAATAAVLLLAAAAIAAITACNRVTEQTEVQRQKLAEQELILAYSANVTKVDQLQKAFTDVWKTANEQTNIKDLKEAFDSRVMPALDAYLKALKEMPTESDNLIRIHAILLDEYEAMAGVFRSFSKDLTEDNIITRHKALLDATDKVHAAERKYYAELKAYYQEYNVTLTEPPNAAAQKSPATPPQVGPAATDKGDASAAPKGDVQ